VEKHNENIAWGERERDVGKKEKRAGVLCLKHALKKLSIKVERVLSVFK
jgi:hypothetical protein